MTEKDKRCRNVVRPRKQEHGKGNGDARNNAGEKTAKHCPGLAHGIAIW
jgi:hypothetical protein